MNKDFRRDSRCPLCNMGVNHTRLEHWREMRVWWGAKRVKGDKIKT